MNPIDSERRTMRLMTWLLALLLMVPFFSACGSRQSAAPPPVDDTRGGQVAPRSVNASQARQGLSTGQKVAILAGAAALYYLYNQHKNKQGQGPQGQYYLSKNGRVYYRDAQHRAHWVTPPSEGIRVPESEAQRYREFQGYNNRSTGRDLSDLAEARTAAPSY